MTEEGPKIESPEVSRIKEATTRSRQLIEKLRQLKDEFKPPLKRKLGPTGKRLTEAQANIPLNIQRLRDKVAQIEREAGREPGALLPLAEDMFKKNVAEEEIMSVLRNLTSQT